MLPWQTYLTRTFMTYVNLTYLLALVCVWHTLPCNFLEFIVELTCNWYTTYF